MKIRCNTRYLLDALALARVRGKTKRESDASVKIVAEMNEPVVRVHRAYEKFNCHVHASMGFNDAEVIEPGEVCVSEKELVAILKTRAKGTVTLDFIDGDEDGLRLEFDMFSTSMQVADPPETLPVAEDEDVFAVKFDAQTFAAVVTRACSVAAIDDLHPALTHVVMELADDHAIFVAAEGFRMSQERIDWSPPKGAEIPDEHVQTLLPRSVCEMFLKSMKPPAGDVELRLGKDGAVMIADELTSISYAPRDMHHSSYPDWRKLFRDKDNERDQNKATLCVMTFDVDDFGILSKIGSVVSKGGNQGLKFEADKLADKITAHTDANSPFTGMTFELAGSVEGNSNRIALNTRFLVDLEHAMRVSSRLDDTLLENMSIAFWQPSSVARFKFAELPGYTCLIMPMYVRWSAPE